MPVGSEVVVGTEVAAGYNSEKRVQRCNANKGLNRMDESLDRV